MLLSLINAEVPLWFAAVLAALREISSLPSRIRRIVRFLRRANGAVKRAVRRWLGVKVQVYMTQSEYAAIPSGEKDPEILYYVTPDK